jgi:acetyltransferase-like isoleucine patch superfamily enzyme
MTSVLQPRRTFARRVLDGIVGTFAWTLRFAPFGSEPWQWARDFVTYMPGFTGFLFRAAFYRRYLKRGGGGELVIAPTAYLENANEIELGDNVQFGHGCWVAGTGGLTIGHNSGIGPRAVIHTANHNYKDPGTRILDQGHDLRPVTIGNDVWVAAGAIVLPGTILGDGVVVAAGSVVSGTVAPYSVVAGFPARKIAVRRLEQPAEEAIAHAAQ